MDAAAEQAGFAEVRQALAGCRYLLVAPVPWFQAPDGTVWLDDLWHRDLMRHLDYLPDLTVLAPRRPFGRQAGLVAVPPRADLRFRAWPDAAGLVGALIKGPAALAAAWAAIGQADIVHSGAAGWPLPPGLIVNPLAVARHRPLVIVVESAFWRLSGPGPHGLGTRLRARVTESLARWSVRRAALSVLTHDGYRQTLATGAGGRVLVTPASWIDAGDLIPQPDSVIAARGDEPRLIFAGRLVPEKGLRTLCDAVDIAAAQGHPVRLDVIGEGPLGPLVADLAARHPGIRLLDPVPYGAPFLSLLSRYHAVIVPSLSDEQPRVLVDAASQAVAAIATDTPGHRALVRPDVTGLLHPPGDAGALAALMIGTATGELSRMGRTARMAIAGQTHQAMHLTRARALADLWQARRPGARQTAR